MISDLSELIPKVLDIEVGAVSEKN